MERFLQGNILFMSWWRSAFKDVNEYAHSNMIENKIILSLLFIKLACLVQMSYLYHFARFLLSSSYLHIYSCKKNTNHFHCIGKTDITKIASVFIEYFFKYYTSIFIWLLYECQLEEKNVSKRLMKDHQKMAKK